MKTPLSDRVARLAPSIIREMSGRRRSTSIDLSLGEPSTQVEPDVLQRAYDGLRAGPQGYTENAGMMPLREAIAAHYALPGRERGENVIVTVGSEEAVFLAMISTLDPGDEVLVPDPGYPAYRNIAGLIGAVPVPYPITRESGLVARPDELAARITGRTRVIVLNGPSNPFGTIDGADGLARIAALADTRGLTVISDEIYADLAYGDAYPVPSICRMTSNTVFVGGLSKSCSMTGLRLGYLIAGAAEVKKMTLAHQLMVTCAARIAQLAALEVFREPSRLRAFIPHYERARAELARVASLLPGDAPLFVGPGAFYAILDVSRYTGDGGTLALAMELLDAEDVVVVPGVAFGSPSGDWFWRLSYAAGAEAVSEGLTRIARFLRARVR